MAVWTSQYDPKCRIHFAEPKMSTIINFKLSSSFGSCKEKWQNYFFTYYYVILQWNQIAIHSWSSFCNCKIVSHHNDVECWPLVDQRLKTNVNSPQSNHYGDFTTKTSNDYFIRVTWWLHCKIWWIITKQPRMTSQWSHKMTVTWDYK